MASTSLTITINAVDQASAKIDSILSRLERAQRQTAKATDLAGNAANNAGKGATRLQRGMGRAADAMAGFDAAANLIGRPVIGAIGGSLQAFQEFEDAMSAVRKTTGLSSKETAALGDEIKAMSRTIPISQKGLADIAESAGSLGIARDDISKFVDTTAKMSTAFDIAPGETATRLGKLANTFGFMNQTTGKLDFGRVQKFGDMINYLGNTSAATEVEILNATQRFSGTAKAMRITENDAAGLTTTMISLGMAPESAATGLNSMFASLNGLNKATPKQAAALADLGLTTQDVMKAMETSPVKAFESILSKAGDAGLKGQAALVGLFGKNHAPKAAQLAQNMDVLAATMARANDATAQQGGMQKEFAARIDTMKARVQLAQNAMNELAINVGGALAPAVTSVLAPITAVIQALASFASANPGITAMIATFAALSAGILVAVAAVGAIGAALAGISVSPILAVAAAITAIGAAAMALKPQLSALFTGFGQGFMAAFGPALDNLKSAFSRLGAALAPAFNAIKAAIQQAFGPGALSGIQNFGQMIGAALGAAAGFVANFVAMIVNAVAAVVEFGNAIAQAFSGDFGGLASIGSGLMSAITGALAGLPGLVMSALASIPNLIMSVFSGLGGLISGALAGLPGLVSSALAAIPSVIAGVFGPVPGLLAGLVASFGSAFSGLGSSIMSGLQGALSGIGSFVQGIQSTVMGVVNGIKSAFASLSGAMNLGGGGGGGFLRGMLSGAQSMIQGLISSLSSIGPMLQSALTAPLMAIGPAITGIVSQVMTLGPQLAASFTTAMASITTGMATIATNIGTIFSSIATTITPAITQIGMALTMAFTTAFAQVGAQVAAFTAQLGAAFTGITAQVAMLGSSLTMAFSTAFMGVQMQVMMLSATMTMAFASITAQATAFGASLSASLTSSMAAAQAAMAAAIAGIQAQLAQLPAIASAAGAQIAAAFQAMAGSMQAAGMAMMSNLAAGITAGIGQAVAAASAAAAAVRGAFPGSYAKYGPFSKSQFGGAGPGLLDVFTTGLQKAAVGYQGTIGGALNPMVGGMGLQPAPMPIGSMATGATQPATSPSASSVFNFSPTINVGSDGAVAAVGGVLAAEREKFFALIREYEARKQRLSYG